MSYARVTKNKETQMRLIRLCALLGAFLLIAACDFGEYPEDAPSIRNESSQTVEIFAIVPGEAQLIRTLDRGLETRFRDECVDPDLEARSQDGRVVAQHHGPLCRGDPQWVIKDTR